MIVNLDKNIQELDKLLCKVNIFCRLNNISLKTVHDLSVVIDEIIGNIISYSSTNDKKIMFSILKKNGDVKLKIVDFGENFNPLLLAPPDVTSDLDSRKIGGLGIYLTRCFSRYIKYKRKDNQNILTIIISVK